MIEKHCEDLKTANKGNNEKPTHVFNKDYSRAAKPTPSVNGEKTRPDDSFHSAPKQSFDEKVPNYNREHNSNHEQNARQTNNFNHNHLWIVGFSIVKDLRKNFNE